MEQVTNQNSITVRQIWSDDDLLELEISVYSNGSLFRNTVYASQNDLGPVIDGLRSISRHKVEYFEFEFGVFGNEWANGYMKLQLTTSVRGQICIRSEQQAAFTPTANTKIADEAKFHLVSEPALMAEFADELANSFGTETLKGAKSSLVCQLVCLNDVNFEVFQNSF